MSVASSTFFSYRLRLASVLDSWARQPFCGFVPCAPQKPHFSAGKCILLQERAFFCRKVHFSALCSGGQESWMVVCFWMISIDLGDFGCDFAGALRFHPAAIWNRWLFLGVPEPSLEELSWAGSSDVYFFFKFMGEGRPRKDFRWSNWL